MLQETLDRIEQNMREAPERGSVANYIPELASIDPNQFAMSVCLADGQQVSCGDIDRVFSMQSVSKAFTLAMALGRFGDTLWARVGREPTNNSFNSVLDLEATGGIPRNPFVNAGAIVVTDALLAGRSPKEALTEIKEFTRMAVGDDEDNIFINHEMARSENVTGHRNWSLAHFLKSTNNLHHPCELTLGTYFHHCAIEMNCAQLARAGRFLAGFGDAHAMIAKRHVRSINAVMMTCGHYDGSGEFAYRVGFPGKSGVSGGILAIVPGVASIAVWSPGLNNFGNSMLGSIALEQLSLAMNWSVFDTK